MVNYYSFFDELAENPWLGILVDGVKPSRWGEAKWFGELYATILQGNAVTCVAVVDGRVVALCEVGRRPRSDLAHIGVLGISVVRGYRGMGMGVGEALLRRILEACRDKFEMVGLSVLEQHGGQEVVCEDWLQELRQLPRGVKRNGEYAALTKCIYPYSKTHTATPKTR